MYVCGGVGSGCGSWIEGAGFRMRGGGDRCWLKGLLISGRGN